jgi:ATP-binding cassette subfamily D (ALD) long-chain fatty acid import protein
MKARGRTDTELASILEHVHLAYLPSREGGWETRKEWKDVLSGGEKQRVSFLGLSVSSSKADDADGNGEIIVSFASHGENKLTRSYHRPSYAILDECTSAVSSDVEGLMYEHAKSIGITLITISSATFFLPH